MASLRFLHTKSQNIHLAVALLMLLIINMSQFIDYRGWYAVQLTTLISYIYVMAHEYQNPVSFNFDISVLRRKRRIINARIIICVVI